ncbi:MAG: N-acetylmuramic acid 6-phosphate etherase [Candidatus Wallbacteria bacterium]|nr:N-acetylmuramic acid 6-phosphate etherase [Candidatus Wallbacteria bacterium]
MAPKGPETVRPKQPASRRPPSRAGLRVTERSNPATEDIDTLDTLGVVDRIHEQDLLVAPAVARERKKIARVVDRVVEAFRSGGRLFYAGAGTSGRLGVLDASECPPTYSTPPELVQGIIAGGYGALTTSVDGAEDDPATARLELRARGLSAPDVVVGIAASGSTPYVRGALQEARASGACAVLVTCNPRAELAALADITVAPVVGPEAIAGSTRMKAGTATKLVPNTITTAAMIRWGKVFGNRMVDVKPACAKLVDRAARLVCELARVPRPKAEELLGASGGRVKTAVVMHCRGLGLPEAEALLEQAGGLLHRALDPAPAAVPGVKKRTQKLR